MIRPARIPQSSAHGLAPTCVGAQRAALSDMCLHVVQGKSRNIGPNEAYTFRRLRDRTTANRVDIPVTCTLDHCYRTNYCYLCFLLLCSAFLFFYFFFFVIRIGDLDYIYRAMTLNAKAQTCS